MIQSLVELDNISKSLNSNNILKNISISIERGDSIAFIGHNGAGKSTLLRILGGLTGVTSGVVRYADNLKVGYIPEHFPKANITVQQFIQHMGRIEGMEKSEVYDKSQLLFQKFYMENMQSTLMKNLSKGTLQKVAVIQALLRKPSLLLLDEPLSGQDMASQEVFVEAVNQLIRDGVAVVMSCHEKFLIHRISNKIIEISDGNLFLRSIDDFSLEEYVVLKFIAKGNHLQLAQKIEQSAQVIEQQDKSLKIKVSRNNSKDVIIELLKDNWELREISHENH